MSIDSAIVLGIQHLRAPWLNLLMQGISFLGSRHFYMAALPFIYWILHRRKGWLIAVVFLVSMECNSILKYSIARERPFAAEPSITCVGAPPGTWAFPSGHAQGGFILWGGLAMMTSSTALRILSGSIIFLIGLSRIYLGVHFPTDVLAGWLLGFATLLILDRLFHRVQDTHAILLPVRLGIAGFAALGMAMFPQKDVYLSACTLLAILFLEPIERTRVHVSETGALKKRLLRCAAGYIPPGVLLVGYRASHIDTLGYHGIFFFCMGAWMALGAPWLFQKLEI